MAPLIRRVAAADRAAAPAPPVVGSWVSPGWSGGIVVTGHPQWPGVDSEESFTSGLVSALLAREDRYGKVSVCGWLVDVWCLGVKDAVPPRVIDALALPGFVERYFGAFAGDPVPAPVELIQHLVFGGIEYARSLGFEPHPDFAATTGHLPPLVGPSAITFGHDGKPLYIQGPHDDPDAIMRRLSRR